MSVNLATKYASKMATEFTLRSLVDGATNKDYDFTGVKSLNVYTPITQPLGNYSRTGANRYGTPTELQDSLQEMILTRDRAFSITIDKGNNTEQMNAKTAAQMLMVELSEQAVPEMDIFALTKFTDYAGNIEELDSTPTANDIVEKLSEGMVKMSNAKVPAEHRFIFIGWTGFGALRLSPQFVGVESLAKESLVKGALGTFMGAQVVVVPDDYLKKGDSVCYFLIAQKNAIIQPKKIQDFFVKENPAGINGALLEGRFIYDAYVLGARSSGVYAAVEAGAKQDEPTLTYDEDTKSCALSSTGANSLRYTLDNTDPRYSKSAAVITGASGSIDLSAFEGQSITIKAAAFDNDLYTSDVSSLPVTVE